ncbi:hypothetical protein D7S86_10500 [Pararobbsia silviterrae]|uniref:Uncharacterized protein n=1 Tax=Pararobbsia silviterrae TaxID=1792498 RepID=A0A494XYH9_9BURK|nr:hypothetical protein D7S86_10500 [Pararobbsia silviterrae]
MRGASQDASRFDNGTANDKEASGASRMPLCLFHGPAVADPGRRCLVANLVVMLVMADRVMMMVNRMMDFIGHRAQRGKCSQTGHQGEREQHTAERHGKTPSKHVGILRGATEVAHFNEHASECESITGQ